MTYEARTVSAPLGKSAASGFLREMIGFAAQRLMDMEVGGLTDGLWQEGADDRPSARAIVSGPGFGLAGFRGGLAELLRRRGDNDFDGRHLALGPPLLSGRSERHKRSYQQSRT